MKFASRAYLQDQTGFHAGISTSSCPSILPDGFVSYCLPHRVCLCHRVELCQQPYQITVNVYTCSMGDRERSRVTEFQFATSPKAAPSRNPFNAPLSLLYDMVFMTRVELGAGLP